MRHSLSRRTRARGDPSVSAIALIGTPRPGVLAMWQSPCFITDTCGYGSLRSQGRRMVWRVRKISNSPSFTDPPAQTHLRDLAAHAREFYLNIPPSHIGGRRECRAPDAPAASRVEKNTRVSHHGHAGSPGIPRAMVLTVSFALSPVTGLVCHRPSADNSADLTPASGRQDHTTSPSASSAVRLSAPSASTASRLTSVTIAKRPSVGTGWRRI
jgi:hypothetical protein